MRLPPDFTLLQVTPALDTGGVEQTTIDIARAVVAAGGRALVASRGGRMEEALAQAGARLLRMPAESKHPVTLSLIAWALEQAVRREGVSIIHARSRAPAFAALRAARRTGTPLVTTYAGIYGGASPWKRWYNGVMTRGDRVIANSAYTRDHIIAAHRTDPAKIATIPRGLDLARFDPATVSVSRVEAVRASWGLATGDRRPVILLAGRLTRWKGQGLLIEALKRVKATGQRNFVAVLAGDAQDRDDYRAELAGQIIAGGLEDQVRIVGHTDDMPAAYLAADLACAPSLKPEAFGRTAVEPQSMSRPVLAARQGAAEETVVDGVTGWLVAPGDADAWANALEAALFAGPAVWKRMGEAGAARARSLYSVEAMSQATLALYADILASKASAPS